MELNIKWFECWEVMEMASKMGSSLPENIAAALSYVMPFLTGVLFLVLDGDNKFVRFHAVQGIGLWIVWFGGWIALTVIPVIGWLLLPFWSLVMFVFWLVAIVKAWQGEKFLLPVIGEYVQKGMKR